MLHVLNGDCARMGLERSGIPGAFVVWPDILYEGPTPLATGVPFNWKDLTPVAMLALDQFVLWVNAETPYKTAKDYLAAVKDGGPNKFKMGGTGSKQEDQIITVAIEKATGRGFSAEERKAIVRGADEIDLVNSGLEETMITAYRQVHEQWKRDSRVSDLRTAAFLTALNKVATTYLELGIFP